MMVENSECPINKNHRVDDYGCFDCFMNQANQKMWEKIEKDELRVKDLKARTKDNT